VIGCTAGYGAALVVTCWRLANATVRARPGRGISNRRREPPRSGLGDRTPGSTHYENSRFGDLGSVGSPEHTIRFLVLGTLTVILSLAPRVMSREVCYSATPICAGADAATCGLPDYKRRSSRV
jgi:hypothetical protein